MRILLDSCCQGDDGGEMGSWGCNCRYNYKYLQAPNYHNPKEIHINTDPSIFLGGAIRGVSDWQSTLINKLLPHFHVFNPRRANYVCDEKNEREQITWEFSYLQKASVVLFYFDYPTLCPITLLEYGKFLGKNRYCGWQKVYPCIHPNYQRKNDVIIQTELESPNILKNITFSLDECVEKIIKENK